MCQTIEFEIVSACHPKSGGTIRVVQRDKRGITSPYSCFCNSKNYSIVAIPATRLCDSSGCWSCQKVCAAIDGINRLPLMKLPGGESVCVNLNTILKSVIKLEEIKKIDENGNLLTGQQNPYEGGNYSGTSYGGGQNSGPSSSRQSNRYETGHESGASYNPWPAWTYAPREETSGGRGSARHEPSSTRPSPSRSEHVRGHEFRPSNGYETGHGNAASYNPQPSWTYAPREETSGHRGGARHEPSSSRPSRSRGEHVRGHGFRPSRMSQSQNWAPSEREASHREEIYRTRYENAGSSPAFQYEPPVVLVPPCDEPVSRGTSKRRQSMSRGHNRSRTHESSRGSYTAPRVSRHDSSENAHPPSQGNYCRVCGPIDRSARPCPQCPPYRRRRRDSSLGRMLRKDSFGTIIRD